MKIALLYFILIIAPLELLSQDCIVAVDSLKGQYTGDCKNGKADGKGTATGIDSYTGDFKNGYPNGEGKYTWANGNSYDGHWKDGLFDGEGTLTTMNKNEKDSVVIIKGSWKKGKFIKQYESQSSFKVSALTSGINDLSIKKLKGSDGQITVIVKSVAAGAGSLSANTAGSGIPKQELSNIQVTEGKFDEQVTGSGSSPITNTYLFRRVSFPFSAVLSFSTPSFSNEWIKTVQQVNIDIKEDGNYYVVVNIDH